MLGAAWNAVLSKIARQFNKANRDDSVMIAHWVARSVSAHWRLVWSLALLVASLGQHGFAQPAPGELPAGSAPSRFAVPESTLAAPAGFVAQNVSDGSVRLQWSVVTGATRYRIDGTGIPSGTMFVDAPSPDTRRATVGSAQPPAQAGVRLQNVPLGPGTWHITSVDARGAWNPDLSATATVVVHGVPPHAGKWLTKNNGSGSSPQALAHYLSLCAQCVPGASFSDVLIALGVSPDALADGNNGFECIGGDNTPCTWTDVHAARYDNVTEFGTSRITRCWEALPAENGANGPRTVCYSKSGDHGLTVIVKDDKFAWFLTFAWKDDQPGAQFANPAKEVVNWFLSNQVAMTSNYALTTQVAMDSEGAKYPPHACLSCHGGTFDGARVTGATLLPLDTGLLRVDDRSVGMARNFLQVNATVMTHAPSPAVQRYLLGLYGGSLNPASVWGDLDYIPFDWKEQSDYYRAAVRPYCTMCHLATPSSLDFTTYGNFARNKDLINAEVCLGHTMPHAEYPFKQFWTKDTGQLFLPGYLAAGVGITNCQ